MCIDLWKTEEEYFSREGWTNESRFGLTKTDLPAGQRAQPGSAASIGRMRKA
jgi:hypothetical protein